MIKGRNTQLDHSTPTPPLPRSTLAGSPWERTLGWTGCWMARRAVLPCRYAVLRAPFGAPSSGPVLSPSVGAIPLSLSLCWRPLSTEKKQEGSGRGPDLNALTLLSRVRKLVPNEESVLSYPILPADPPWSTPDRQTGSTHDDKHFHIAASLNVRHTVPLVLVARHCLLLAGRTT